MHYEITLNFKKIETSLNEEPVIIIEKAEHAYHYIKDAFEARPFQESTWIIPMDRKSHPLGRHMLCLGTLTQSTLDTKAMFRCLLMTQATQFILSHNHPSGMPAPSQSDISTTRQVKEMARIMDYDFTDHVVVGRPEMDPQKNGYASLKEMGLI
ncbi:hypothetical protein OH491_24780 [Termitidicoccus mucosus]|uniref:MPN domain-containing protein n=1 Tax=Termitidicoccus mucosus TaxID=1184151 RepID=A0A178IQZ1_9BACT|nr:hypothetical protein AW736_01745 [Opitutaceae bacterium TSB47]